MTPAPPGRRRRAVRRGLLVIYLVLIAELLYLLVMVTAPWLPDWFPVPSGVLGLSRGPWVNCEPQPTSLDFGRSIATIGYCVGFFLIGSVAGVIRYESRRDDPRSRRFAWLYQTLMVLLYWAIALTLLYEAFGTWKTDLNPNDPNLPITWYVRCAIRNQTGLTLIATATLCLLAGHWLHRRTPPPAQASRGRN